MFFSLSNAQNRIDFSDASSIMNPSNSFTLRTSLRFPSVHITTGVQQSGKGRCEKELREWQPSLLVLFSEWWFSFTIPIPLSFQSFSEWSYIKSFTRTWWVKFFERRKYSILCFSSILRWRKPNDPTEISVCSPSSPLEGAWFWLAWVVESIEINRILSQGVKH